MAEFTTTPRLQLQEPVLGQPNWGVHINATIERLDAITAIDTQVMHLTGNETVTGIKTFSTGLSVANGKLTYTSEAVSVGVTGTQTIISQIGNTQIAMGAPSYNPYNLWGASTGTVNTGRAGMWVVSGWITWSVGTTSQSVGERSLNIIDQSGQPVLGSADILVPSTQQGHQITVTVCAVGRATANSQFSLSGHQTSGGDLTINAGALHAVRIGD